MSLPIYRDIEGELHPEHEVSRHHVYGQSLTPNGKPKKFINQYPLVPKMLNGFHQSGPPEALHTNVELLRPPPMFVILCLQSVINDLDSTGQYNQLIEFVDRVDAMSTQNGNPVIRKECGRLADNMERQLPYILIGQVELVPHAPTE